MQSSEIRRKNAGIEGLSDKDLMLFKKVYRKVIQMFYENKQNESIYEDLFYLGRLVEQTIESRKESDILSLVSVLQILKVKSKAFPDLIAHTDKIINHLKNPTKNALRYETLLFSLQKSELFALGCTIAIRFYEQILCVGKQFDWKSIISELGKNCSVSTSLCVELMIETCKDNELHCKLAVKSGLIKYIFSSYINMALQDKFNLYKAIKLLKMVSSVDKTILKEREKGLALIIYTYEEYIAIAEEICNKCYDESYAQQIDRKRKFDDITIDQPYLWSYHQSFTQNHLSSDTLSELKKSLHTPLSKEREAKTYAILSNYSKFKDIVFKEEIKILPKSQQGLLNYLKMCMNATNLDASSVNNIDFKGLQELAFKSSNAKVDKFFKYLNAIKNKQIKPTPNKKYGKAIYNVDNADFLMQKSPMTAEKSDIFEQIRQILAEKDRKNEMESDVLRSLKDKALNSLHQAIIQKKKFDFNKILNSFQLYDVKLTAKLLHSLQIYLTINPDQIQHINFKRVAEIIDWLQNNYKGEIIDWGSIGQLLKILEEDQEWKSHVASLPQKKVWLLTIEDPSLNDEKTVLSQVEKLKPLYSKQANKMSIIVGFLGNVLQPEAKARLIKKDKTIQDIMQQLFKCLSEGKHFKTVMYLLSYFVKNWHCEGKTEQNKVFQQFIQPFVKITIDNFRSTEQEYVFLQSCLPFRIDGSKISENLDFLLNQYGKLASYIYQLNKDSTKPKQISYEKIGSTINSEDSDRAKLMELLDFLEDNSEVLQSDQIRRITDNVLDDPAIYWKCYPNFLSILSRILKILAKSNNPNINKHTTDILIKIMNKIQDNDDISDQQKQDIYRQIAECLKNLSGKLFVIEIQKIKKMVNKIKYVEIREEIIFILSNFKKREQQKEKEEKKKQVLEIKIEQKNFQVQKPVQIEKKKEPIVQEIISIPPVIEKEQQKISHKQAINIQPTVIEIQKNEIILEKMAEETEVFEEEQAETIPEKEMVDNQNKEDLQLEDGLLDIDKLLNQATDLFSHKSLHELELSVIQALRALKRIVDKKDSVEGYPKLHQIFLKNSAVQKYKDILGHLLVKFYSLSQRPQVINLLLMKNKTALSKEACYQIVKKYQQAFVLSRRWKFLGRQWLDTAIQRMQQGYFADSCQVLEYNLVKIADIEYFYSKNYHEIVIKMEAKATSLEEMVYYMLLIGTSSRIQQVKKYYTTNSIHIKILRYLREHSDQLKIVSNIAYALSSLVYMQPEICLEIVKNQDQMHKIVEGYKHFCDDKSVVETGACLFANLAYSNEQVKEILRFYKTIDALLFAFQKNLQKKPEMETFKQLLRAFGNLSLSKKCTEEIVNGHFCKMAVKMTQQLDIFVNYDDKKAKLMKILIDLVANLSAHKSKLEIIHEQKMTLLMLTLLETTEANPAILIGCIDTIDALCQNSKIENYAVTQKKLPYILIDVLKIQQDEKIVMKSTRLLTNLTINPICVPYILEANLLSILANIVMPQFAGDKLDSESGKKMQKYIQKIIKRIFQGKQSLNLILKSGYLDCLVRSIQTYTSLEDNAIDILYFYSENLPSFLNKRAFICLIKVLTHKLNHKQTIEKCLRILKNLLNFSYDKDEEDLVIEGINKMYQQFLAGQYRQDALILLTYHLLRSTKLRKIIQKDQKIKMQIKSFSSDSRLQYLCKVLHFVLHNPESHIMIDQNPQNEDKYYKILRKGLICKLYRSDGSCKKAKIDIDQEYNLRVYKYPDGDVKGKYVVNIKTVKDFQANYEPKSEQWNSSIYTMEKGIFQSSSANPALCFAVLGSSRWGQFILLNVEFENIEDKQLFFRAFSSIMYVFRG